MSEGHDSGTIFGEYSVNIEDWRVGGYDQLDAEGGMFEDGCRWRGLDSTQYYDISHGTLVEILRAVQHLSF